MPLFRGVRYTPAPLPENFGQDDLVHHCAITGEVFGPGDAGSLEYMDRTMLCNSLEWSCAATGKTGLTFEEALESELTAKEKVDNMADSLKIPILSIVRLTKRGSFNDLCEDIYQFAKDRYFIGEMCYVEGENSTKDSMKVVKVVYNRHLDTSLNEELLSVSDSDAETSSNQKKKKKKAFCPSADCYSYVLEDKFAAPFIVDNNGVSRKKGVYGREKSRLLLRMFCTPVDGYWQVKHSCMERFKLGRKMFLDIFGGPLPVFNFTPKSRQPVKTKASASNSSLDTYAKQEAGQSNTSRKPKSSTIDLANELRLQEIVKQAEEKLLLAAEKERQRFICEEEKRARIEERILAREKAKEDRQISLRLLREWSRIREDLELEDLKPLPQLVQIQTRLTSSDFGDAVFVLEFLNIFGDVFGSSEELSESKWCSFRRLEDGLVDKTTQNFFFSLTKFLLKSIFNLQVQEMEEQETEKDKEGKESEVDGEDDTTDVYSCIITDNMSDALTRAKNLALWPQKHLGSDLIKLRLESFTITEVLRLHLQAAGFKFGSMEKWQDNPSFQFSMNETKIMQEMLTGNLFDLSATDKLKILKVLIEELLSYEASRGIIDDYIEQLRSTNKEIRRLQGAERQHAKDEFEAKMRHKKHEMVKQAELQAGTSTEPIETDQGYNSEEEKLEQDEREKARRERQQQLIELQGSITKVERGLRIMPLGRDRFYRRVWMFKSISGLFIEDNVDFPHICLNNPTPTITPMPVSSSPSNGNKENVDTSAEIEVDCSNGEVQKSGVLVECTDTNTNIESIITWNCTANDYCPVHSPEQRSISWSYCPNEEGLDTFISALNQRGVRENNLKQTLIREKAAILSSVELTKADDFHTGTEDENLASVGKPVVKNGRLIAENTVEELLELSLREQLMDLEEKLYSGGLGILPGVDRAVWHDALQNGSYLHPDSTANSLKEEKQTLSEVVVHDLGCALLEISKGIHSKFMKPPVGLPQEKKKKKKVKDEQDESTSSCKTPVKTVFEYWQESVGCCKSIPQIFLHLAALEKSIMWSKSITNVGCRLCKRKGNDEKMLLCDGCDRGHHMDCLKPKMRSVPRGDWFCSECKPVEVKSIFKARKKKEHVPIVDSSSTEAETDSDQAENENNDVTTTTGASSEEDEDHRKSNRTSRRRKRNKLTFNKANACQKLLDAVFLCKNGWPFIHPVDKKTVPDYYEIISEPMDFTRIQEKLEADQYDNVSEFLSDVVLIFLNCEHYNVKSAKVYKTGQLLYQFIDEKASQLGLPTLQSIPSNRENGNRKRMRYSK